MSDRRMHTFIVYVENKPGVLSRVVSLFRRRAFNIDSLTVGRTEKPEVSRMTIVTEADPDQARRIVANVYKLVNVLLVDDLTGQTALLRDLVIAKVNAPLAVRHQVLGLAEVFRARVLDIAADSIILELTGGEEKIDRLLELLDPSACWRLCAPAWSPCAAARSLLRWRPSKARLGSSMTTAFRSLSEAEGF